MKETFRLGIKDERHKESKKYADNKAIYKHRNNIEGVFSNVKSEGQDYFDTKIKELAKLHVLSVFVLFNVEILFLWLFMDIYLRRSIKNYRRFSNSSI
ncbi:MAG: hypothetical protein N2380_02580 [bacterium]|nr:hypothetical protein [bacterium]